MTAENQKPALADLSVGQTAIIADLPADLPGRDRWLELGFTSGASVEVMRRALGGDPIQIRIRGTRYALRQAEASRIPVENIT